MNKLNVFSVWKYTLYLLVFWVFGVMFYGSLMACLKKHPEVVPLNADLGIAEHDGSNSLDSINNKIKAHPYCGWTHNDHTSSSEVGFCITNGTAYVCVSPYGQNTYTCAPLALAASSTPPLGPDPATPPVDIHVLPEAPLDASKQ